MRGSAGDGERYEGVCWNARVNKEKGQLSWYAAPGPGIQAVAIPAEWAFGEKGWCLNEDKQDIVRMHARNVEGQRQKAGPPRERGQ